MALRSCVVAMVVVSEVLLVFAQVPSFKGLPARSNAEREVLAAEKQMHVAYVEGDKALFRDLYSEDSTFTFSSGTTVGRDERVKSLRPFPDLQDEITSLQVVGDVALVRCISDYANATIPGRTKITILRVWMRQAGKWRVQAFQSTVVQ